MRSCRFRHSIVHCGDRLSTRLRGNQCNVLCWNARRARSPRYVRRVRSANGRRQHLVGAIDRLRHWSVIDMLAAYDLSHCKTSATYNLGGVLDIVALRADMLQPHVGVNDVGVSGHRLLRWTMPLSRPSPVYLSIAGRSWSLLDRNSFHAALRSSQLGRPDFWSVLDVEGLARLYDSEITSIVDGMIPIRTVRFVRRPSNP
jgi:hypothetical protein